jgi:hypothetical protein
MTLRLRFDEGGARSGALRAYNGTPERAIPGRRAIKPIANRDSL